MKTRIAAAALALFILAGCSSKDASDSPSSETTSTESSSADSTKDATDKPTEEATDTEPQPVTPVISDEGMPSVVEKDGQTTLDFSNATEPKQLQVSVVKEGSGREITPKDLVIVNYAGQVWGNPDPFDSSFERGAPASFKLSNVVQGWRDGLAGQKIGSRVIVSIPADLGYGPSGGNERAGIGAEDTIVFVVDIIDAISPDASGDPNAKKVDLPKDTPVTVTGDLGKVPSIDVKEGAAEPKEIKVIMVAEADGPKVGGEGSMVYVRYAATTWDNVQKKPADDGIQDAVIGQNPIWDNLTGIPVGSRVILLVPGQEGNPSMAAVVDIVAQQEVPKK